MIGSQENHHLIDATTKFLDLLSNVPQVGIAVPFPLHHDDSGGYTNGEFGEIHRHCSARADEVVSDFVPCVTQYVLTQGVGCPT